MTYEVSSLDSSSGSSNYEFYDIFLGLVCGEEDLICDSLMVTLSWSLPSIVTNFFTLLIIIFFSGVKLNNFMPLDPIYFA